MPVHPSILQKGGARAPVHPPPSYGPVCIRICLRSSVSVFVSELSVPIFVSTYLSLLVCYVSPLVHNCLLHISVFFVSVRICLCLSVGPDHPGVTFVQLILGT